MRNNQAGFGGGAIFFLLVIVALVGFTYYRVQRADQNIETYNAIDSFDECVAAGNQIMESYPEQCAANGVTFSNPAQKVEDMQTISSQVTIAEFGVQFELPPEVSTLYYDRNPNVENAVYFSLEELKNTDCAADKVSVAALVRYTMEELADMESSVRVELPYIDGYYYVVESPQAMCSDNPSIQQKADDTRAVVMEAVERSLRLAQ